MHDFTASAPSVPYLDKTFTVRITKDVKYGVGGVDYSAEKGATRHRDLTLDIYEPHDETTETNGPLRPALIMAFGGAFHRGSKEDDVVEEGEHRNTPVSEYCREFARRGYVCFSIDYRLMQEAPDPGVTPTIPPGTQLNTDRVNFVRGLLGLAPCTNQMMANEIEAATDDMSKAIAFVRSRSHALRIDHTRIAAGGFSAGAIIALNAAFAERAPVAAVVALSGRISMATAETYVTGPHSAPPVLMFVGENDLPAMLDNIEGPAAHMADMGVTNDVVRIAGATHFYPGTARVVARDGSSTDVETLMATFLHLHLRLGRMHS